MVQHSLIQKQDICTGDHCSHLRPVVYNQNLTLLERWAPGWFAELLPAVYCPNIERWSLNHWLSRQYLLVTPSREPINESQWMKVLSYVIQLITHCHTPSDLELMMREYHCLCKHAPAFKQSQKYSHGLTEDGWICGFAGQLDPPQCLLCMHGAIGCSDKTIQGWF